MVNNFLKHRLLVKCPARRVVGTVPFRLRRTGIYVGRASHPVAPLDSRGALNFTSRILESLVVCRGLVAPWEGIG
jgi:hypothetical protein